MTSNGFADDRHEPGLGIRDWGMASFPADWDASSSWASVFVDRAEDLVLYGAGTY